jgi:hypothetical protein
MRCCYAFIFVRGLFLLAKCAVISSILARISQSLLMDDKLRDGNSLGTCMQIMRFLKVNLDINNRQKSKKGPYKERTGSPQDGP